MSFGIFQSVTPEDQCIRKPLHLADADLVNPGDADCLEQGEWVVPAAVDGRNYERYGNAAGNGPSLAYPVAAPKGSTDQQALNRVEVYVKWEEALTTTYNNGGTYDAGTYLKVLEVDVDGSDRSILTPVEAADGEEVQAMVVHAPAAAADNTPMRIRRVRFVGEFA